MRSSNWARWLCSVAVAAALIGPASTANAQWVGSWATYPRTFNIYWGQPAACDAPAKAGATTWNNAGAKFTYSDGGVITTSVFTSDPNTTTTLDSGPPPPGYEDASAWTPTDVQGVNPPASPSTRLYDTDIIVISNRWSEMYCGSELLDGLR